MKLAKTSVIALALSAMFAGPVLAQGVSTDSQVRGGMQGRGMMQNGPSGAADEELNAQTGAATDKAGVTAKSGTRGTVGAGGAAHKGAGSDATPGSKKY
jgi:hypothetical protein